MTFPASAALSENEHDAPDHARRDSAREKRRREPGHDRASPSAPPCAEAPFRNAARLAHGIAARTRRIAHEKKRLLERTAARRTHHDDPAADTLYYEKHPFHGKDCRIERISYVSLETTLPREMPTGCGLYIVHSGGVRMKSSLWREARASHVARSVTPVCGRINTPCIRRTAAAVSGSYSPVRGTGAVFA